MRARGLALAVLVAACTCSLTALSAFSCVLAVHP